jgi:hypothetical protein
MAGGSKSASTMCASTMQMRSACMPSLRNHRQRAAMDMR